MNWRRPVVLAVAMASVALSAGAAGTGRGADTGRPDHWAQPVPLPGAPNLHKVSDVLYRSAQPSADGMAGLKAMGIKTVVNLRAFHSDRDEIGATGLGYEHIFMNTWHPGREDVVRFLHIVTDPARAPVLVHCQHGADRTGMMVALYRVAVQGWDKSDAAREMTEGGFGFHEIWSNLVPWIEGLDIEAVKREAGIEAMPRAGNGNPRDPPPGNVGERGPEPRGH